MQRILTFLMILLLASPILGQEETATPKTEPAASSSGSDAQVQRGKYLVHDVAMCIMCHTPKTSDGKLIMARLLQGSPMPVSSPYPRQTWAFRAPALVGLGGFSEDTIVTLLQTGSRPDGETPELPMPPYRMTEADARAVAAYLKSLR